MTERTETEVIGLDDVTGWPFDPVVPFVLSGGRPWTPREPTLYRVNDRGRLTERIGYDLRHPPRSKPSTADRTKLDAALERARADR